MWFGWFTVKNDKLNRLEEQMADLAAVAADLSAAVDRVEARVATLTSDATAVQAEFDAYRANVEVIADGVAADVTRLDAVAPVDAPVEPPVV